MGTAPTSPGANNIPRADCVAVRCCCCCCSSSPATGSCTPPGCATRASSPVPAGCACSASIAKVGLYSVSCQNSSQSMVPSAGGPPAGASILAHWAQLHAFRSGGCQQPLSPNSLRDMEARTRWAAWDGAGFSLPRQGRIIRAPAEFKAGREAGRGPFTGAHCSQTCYFNCGRSQAVPLAEQHVARRRAGVVCAPQRRHPAVMPATAHRSG